MTRVIEFQSEPDPPKPQEHHLAVDPDDGTIMCPNSGDGKYHNVELFEWVERSWSVSVNDDGTIIADTTTDECLWESSHPVGYGLVCRGCVWTANGVTASVDFK
jgi:uncharacterized protein (DUF427 family)